MRFSQLRRYFNTGNVCVTGLRGRGKDMILANIACRNKRPYISNVDYTQDERYIPLDLSELDCGKNTYKEFIDGTPHPYVFPYADGTDVYISDVGVYFPSQYCNELNRDYKYFPVYMALSRQLSSNNIFVNVQNLNRCWDKIREQSDTYIYCRWCKVLFGKIVVQKITIYDKYESCLSRMETPRVRVPLFNRQARMQARIYLDQFRNTHGTIKTRWLLYLNKSRYDTRVFKKMLKGDAENGNT